MASKQDKSLAIEASGKLESLLNERIAEMSDVKGVQGERHAFVLYRELLWQIRKHAGLRPNN